MRDHTELRAAANAIARHTKRNGWYDTDSVIDGITWPDEASFIAIASPETILALLDERDALAARLDRLEHAAREAMDWDCIWVPARDPEQNPAVLADLNALRSILEEGNTDA